MLKPTRGELIDLMAVYADWVLESIHREYPNHVSHSLRNAKDLAEPRQHTPIFYGCYDWHSSVHSHWMLVRLARLFPEAPYADRALDSLASSFVADGFEAEFDYLNADHRQTFERPYGLAWLLQLGSELRQWSEERARNWKIGIEPLETLAADRLAGWLGKLTYPIRSGEHSQTAFAMGLALDWSRTADEATFETLLIERARDYFLSDCEAPLAWEPSGHDFLSPCLAEADLMRRCMDPSDFGDWLERFMPFLPTTGEDNWLAPVQVIVIGISEHQTDYVNQIAEQLSQAGYRVETDVRNEKVGYKIREAETMKIPFMAVAGAREMESGGVSVRRHGQGDLGSMTVNGFIQSIDADVKQGMSTN